MNYFFHVYSKVWFLCVCFDPVHAPQRSQRELDTKGVCLFRKMAVRLVVVKKQNSCHGVRVKQLSCYG